MDLTLEYEREEDGRWLAEVPQLPGVLAYGATADEAMARAEVLALRVMAERIEQGERVMALRADSKAVDVLAPVSGEILAINQRALMNPSSVNADPYGAGWLLKVRAPRLESASRQLLSGTAARCLMTSSWEELSALCGTQLGTVMHDGGIPVDGFARAVDEEHWDDVARRFLRT